MIFCKVNRLSASDEILLIKRRCDDLESLLVPYSFDNVQKLLKEWAVIRGGYLFKAGR